MFPSLPRLALVVMSISFAVVSAGCAVAPRAVSGTLGALTSSNVSINEARRGLTPVQGRVVDVAPATLSDATAINQQRAAGGAAGGLVGYAVAQGLKASKAGLFFGAILGSTAGEAAVRNAGPSTRKAEQVIVKLASGKLVGVIQEVDETTAALRIDEPVYVVYGPQSTRVVRRQPLEVIGSANVLIP